MKKMLTLSVMFILCLLTFATDFMRVKFKDGNIVKYEVDNIEEVDFEIGKDTSAIGDTTAIDTSDTPLKFRITSGSTAEVIHGNLYANIDAISIPGKVRIGGKIYSVTSIGSSAFENCSSLTSINIPEGVTSIDSASFVGCSSLASIQIPNSVTSIGDFAFYGCGGLTNVKISEKVRRIGNSAFSGCNGLTRIQIPSSVTDIDELAFYRCINLDVAIDNYEGNVALGFGAFEGCKSVTYLKNNDITAIDTSDTPLKFRITSDSTAILIKGNYSNLDSISIPAKVRIGDKIYSVTSIGARAFSGCSGLINTHITIPASVASIDSGAFAGSNLKSIEISEGITSITEGAFAGCDSLKKITIPNSVTSIERYAFAGCSGLTSINIPEGVTSIGGSAFEGCSGLTSINIPEGVTSIEGYAFAGCSGLTSIQIPDGVTNIDYSIFNDCSGLMEINVASNNPIYSSENGVVYNKEKTKIIYVLKGIKDEIVIPEGVTSIGGSAFEGCSGLTSINIPEGVTSIEGSAFYGCSGLTSINIPEGVTSIKGFAFYGCSGLTSINISESVTNIGYYAFRNCTNLNVVIDNSKDNVEVDNYAFQGCKSVTYLK